MANKRLATYLNNHLAASVTVLDLLASLEDDQGDTDIAHFAAALRAEIEEEQRLLKTIMDQLEITHNRPRQAIGRLAEKLAQVKLSWDDAQEGSLHLLESLEVVLTGLEGKRGLWSALAAAAIPGLPAAEYERLVKRSQDQQQRVEAVRLAAAKQAFAG